MDRSRGRDQRPCGADVPRDNRMNVSSDTLDEAAQRFAKIEQDEVTYHVPAEFTVDNPPAPASIGWPNPAAFKASFSLKGNDVITTRTEGYNFTMLDPKEYGDLHDFYQKVAAADQQQLVLTRSQTARGN